MKSLLELLALLGTTTLPTLAGHAQTPGRPSPHDVAIETSDGGRVGATYYDPGRSGPAVVIFRNCDQQRASVDQFARKLASRGLHVVAYDYRTGNPPAGKTWGAWRSDDAGDVFRWLSAQPRVEGDRLVAVGGSCGSTLALNFAANHPRQTRGVVALSMGPPDSAVKAFLAQTPTLPVLGGASTAENSAPNLDALVKSSRNTESRLIVVPTGHGTEMLKAASELEGVVIDWIVARLRAS
jgi:dienelactone hydrolase